MEAAIDAGRKAIASNRDARFYSLIWNSPAEGIKGATGALFVELGRRDGGAFVVAQPYHQDRQCNVTKVDSMRVAPAEENLWEGKPISSKREPDDDTNIVAIDHLEDVAEEALRMGVSRLKDHSETPIMMFINEEGDIEFVETGHDASCDARQEIANARMTIRERDDAIYYALVYCTWLTLEGDQRSEAIVAEVGDRGTYRALMYARKYVSASAGAKLKIGKMFLLESTASMWGEPDEESDDDDDETVQEGYVNIDTLEDLSHEVFDQAVDRLVDEISNPFVMIITREAEILTHDITNDEGQDSDQVLKAARAIIAKTDDGVMAALVYHASMEIDGETRDVLVAEVEEREGEALMYAQTYALPAAEDEPEVGEPFVVTDIPHLWNDEKS
ncbi:MAG: hypothetical protein JWN70_5161 [Planctomycetaceae bacterium]|nr:hypothetical protein [Planctomycetaceae bacterium]